MSRVMYTQSYRVGEPLARGVAMRRIRRLDGPRLRPYVVEVSNRWDWNLRPRPVYWAETLAEAFRVCGLRVETEVVHR